MNQKKFRNVKLTGIEIYVPNKKVTNEDLKKNFKNLGINDGLFYMDVFGRETRYFVEKDENSLTMAIKASQKLIKETKVNPMDLDAIIFTSDNPEYTLPSNAMKINHALGAKNAHIVLDMNANCIGMLTALDFASRYAKSNKSINKMLIVGSSLFSTITKKDDVISHPNFSDGSCAILLDVIEEDEEKGFINSKYYTNSDIQDKVTYPKCGYSNILNSQTHESDKKMNFEPHDVSFFSDKWAQLITDLLEENDVDFNTIDHFLFSQFNIKEIEETMEKIKQPSEKFTFVGRKYGYTGVASPFFALYDTLQDNIIKENSTIVFCSVGVGYTMSSILYKF